jgi:hypothetical protein
MAFIKHGGKTYWAPKEAVAAHEAKLKEQIEQKKRHDLEAARAKRPLRKTNVE